MPCRSLRFSVRLFNEKASAKKPTPTMSHAISTAPGEATPASWPVMANTPEPMHELITIPMSPMSPMPFFFSSILQSLLLPVLYPRAPCALGVPK